MRIEFYGLVFETPHITIYLWMPWRASALEHRLFEAINQLPGVAKERDYDELRIHVTETKTWRAALQGISRVLKGWQEEADPGRERRAWRWLVEADTDDHGYDHAGEPVSLWAFLQLGLDRGEAGDTESKMEQIDLNGFGARIWPAGKA